MHNKIVRRFRHAPCGSYGSTGFVHPLPPQHCQITTIFFKVGALQLAMARTVIKNLVCDGDSGRACLRVPAPELGQANVVRILHGDHKVFTGNCLPVVAPEVEPQA